MIENFENFTEQVRVLTVENNVSYYKPQYDGRDFQFDFYQMESVDDKMMNNPIFIKTLFVKGYVYQMNSFYIDKYCPVSNFLLD